MTSPRSGDQREQKRSVHCLFSGWWRGKGFRVGRRVLVLMTVALVALVACRDTQGGTSAGDNTIVVCVTAAQRESRPGGVATEHWKVTSDGGDNPVKSATKIDGGDCGPGEDAYRLVLDRPVNDKTSLTFSTSSATSATVAENLASLSPSPTAAPTASPSPTQSPSPVPSPTVEPTKEPTPTETARATAQPRQQTAAPTAQPTVAPTPSPTPSPTRTPTPTPSPTVATGYPPVASRPPQSNETMATGQVLFQGAPVVNGCLVLNAGPCAATTGADGRFQLNIPAIAGINWNILVYRAPGTTPRTVPFAGSTATSVNLGTITLP